MAGYEYDMIVIGSGPAGQKCAVQAAKLGKRVVVVDINPSVGGVCLHDGTIPSKSFREAIVHFTGYRFRTHFGEAYRVKQRVEMKDLTTWSGAIVENIEQTLRNQLARNRVEVICGFGTLQNANCVQVKQRNHQETLCAETIVIATGTKPRRPKDFEFDNEVILDSNGILYMERLPKSLAVVGGGVIGCEYGSMFATLGVDVTIIEARPAILGFVDRELQETLAYQLRRRGVTLLLNEKVVKCRRSPDGRAVTFLESGKRVVSEVLLVSAGRVGNVEELGLDQVGITHDAEVGKIQVNEHFQTSVPNIYAVGDITGIGNLASTAIEQGRRAACHALKLDDPFPNFPVPWGIFTIPEIAMVGRTESQLTADRIPYETGVCRFEELERGKILGENEGMLKILFDRNSLQLLGVHVIGESSAELIHIGQMAMALQADLHFLMHQVFTYPSLSQAYKIAALDGFNKVVSTRGLPDEA